MTKSSFSRRAWLQGAGASAALLPLLSSSSAKAAGFPKRLVVISWPNGIHPPEFWPSGSETDFTFGKILKPMEPFKKDMLVLGGLDVDCFIGQPNQDDSRLSDAGWGHSDFLALLSGTRFTKWTGQTYVTAGESVDQTIADQLAKTTGTPFPSLIVGARTSSGGNSCISSRAGTEGLAPESDPAKLFNSLFASRSLPKPELDKLKLQRKSVLDYLGKSLESFASRVSTEDKAKIGSHLSAVRDLERQFTASGVSVGCTAPGKPSADFTQLAAYPALVKVQMDLMVNALRCDLTRVITYTMTNTGGSGAVFSWLGADYLGAGDEYTFRDHHDIAHNQGKSADHLRRYVDLNAWYYQQFAYFIKQLKDTPEGDGSLLDNTAVVITNNVGSNHNAVGLPWVIVGGCGGAFKTGRLLRYGGWANKTGQYWNNKGIAHNALLVSLHNAMVDVPRTTVGDPKFGSGELPGLRG